MTIITGVDLANFLGNSHEDQQERLDLAASAASFAVTEYCGRLFETDDSPEETVRPFRLYDSERVAIDDAQSISKVEVSGRLGQFTEWDATQYRLEPLGQMRHGRPWPWTDVVSLFCRFPWNGIIRVTGIWGWDAVPDDVLQAAYLKGARLFRRKESPEGIVGGSIDFGPIRLTSRDWDVMELLSPFVRGVDVGV